MENKKLFIGCVLLISIVIFVLVSPFVVTLDYVTTDLYNINMKPSTSHLLGTDNLGRDVFSRLVYGARISILIGILSAICQVSLGSFIGIISGYFRGKIDSVIVIIIDVFMCFPFLIIAIVIATIFEPNIVNLIFIIICLQWMEVARIVRAKVIFLTKQDFIISSKSIGFLFKDMLVIHIIPNILPIVAVASTVAMANAILIESSLSFLGLGVRPPMPSLGNLLEAAQNFRALQSYWWIWLPAGVLIILLVMAINLIGEGLKKVFRGERL